MKKQNLFLSFLAMFFGLTLMFSSQFVLGQDSKNDKEVKVKIVQNIHGETNTIEKSFSADDKDALRDLLKEFDVNIDEQELLNDKQIEISIRKTDKKSEDEDVVIKLEKVIGGEQTQPSPKPFLGVILDDIEIEEAGNSENHEVVVAKVMKETAAEKAGIKEGDLITKVNDKFISGSRQFQDVIHSFQPGEEITIYFQRDGKNNSVKAVLGEKAMPDRFHNENFEWHSQMPPMMKFHHMEDMKTRPFLGVFPSELLEDGAEKQMGVVIGEVIEKSTAQELGLMKGDVIVEINDKSVNNFEELREAISTTKVGDELKVEWKRNGEAMAASAPIKSKAECKAICLDEEKMAHCGGMMKEYKIMLDENKEMSKEIIEKTIERLEGKIANLKEQLKQLSINGENPGVKTEETKVTITIEDISKNNLEAENLVFSPNPNNGKFALSFELPGKGKTSIKIFDANNKEIYNEALGKFSGRYDGQIDVSKNPKGIYFLQITQENKVLNKKIVIQ